MSANAAYLRHWWRVWYFLAVLALVWLGIGLWLGRAEAPWLRGWVGWWTGDRMGGKPLWFAPLASTAGSEIALVEGDPAIRVHQGGSVHLGYWREKRRDLTWAGWIRVTLPSNAWPEGFLTVRELRSADLEIRIGLEQGRPAVRLESHPGKPHQPAWKPPEMVSPRPVPLGQWVYLAFSTDGRALRLTLNGATVGETTAFSHAQIQLGSLNLRGSGEPSAGEAGQVVVHDDVVVFDRVVPPEELASLVARGRGAWVRELDRPARARQWWELGRFLALAGLAWVLARVRPGAVMSAARLLTLLTKPSFREVRWVVGVGLLMTGLAVVALAKRAAWEDQRRFDEILARFQQDNDLYWENLAALLNRARDWISMQTNLTQDAWNTWLLANRFPQDYAGVIGVGYAEQVLPENIPAHEARWAERHGFPYRLQPGLEVPRRKVQELEGDPRLPVVLFESRRMDRSLWFTNHTILGRDLLFQAVEDARPWAAARRVEEVAARNEVQTSSMEEIAPAAWFGVPVQGLQLYVPWTLRTKSVESAGYPLEASAWRGVVFASIDPKLVLREQFGDSQPLVGLRLRTGGSSGEVFDLVADSGEIVPASAEHPGSSLRGSLEIPFYYRRLLVDAWTTRAFGTQSLRLWPWYVGAAGCVLSLLTASLLFVQTRARQKQGEALEALRLAHAELLQAQREREELSRDLHDGSIQSLYGLGLHLQRVLTLATAQPERAEAELAEAIGLLDQTIADLRRFMLSAGESSFDSPTVAKAIERFAERLRRASDATFELHLDPESATLAPGQSIHVLNIVRESVSNALRHGHARHIVIRLGRLAEPTDAPARWRLEIADDGCGFAGLATVPHGHGLQNLAHRAAELGGRLDIESAPGAGTKVRVAFP